MLVITSLGTSRIDRQQKCVDSWLSRDCRVVAVQSIGETELLKEHFPKVRFVETGLVGDMFNKPKHVRISALLQQVTEDRAMIINSDIEIQTSKAEFTEYWSTDLKDGEVKIGIRWDHCPKTGKCQVLKYGIDVFLLSKKAASLLPDIGLTIGCPAWDYWIPYHLSQLGFKVLTSKRKEFIHEVHQQNWNPEDYEKGLEIMESTYRHVGLNRKKLTEFILRLTDRSNLPKTRLT